MHLRLHLAPAVRAAVLLLSALLISGCASSAVRPPTPAAKLRTEDLLQMPKPSGERYYLCLFGSENFLRQPSHVHTWATMIRVVGDPASNDCTIEPRTISWGPATEKTRPWNLHVEPGANWDLHYTVGLMLKDKQRIVMWGPYEVWHGNYTRFTTQKAFMDSGQVQYQCIDNIGEAARTGAGCDCIHSISDMDPMFARERYPLTYFGIPATRNIVKQILTRPVVIDAPKTHDWLIPALRLTAYPIEREFYSGEFVSFTPQAMQEALQQRSEAGSRSFLAIFRGS